MVCLRCPPGLQVHKAWCKKGVAPKLFDVRQVGGSGSPFTMVVMEHLRPEDGWKPLHDALEQCKWRGDSCAPLKEAVLEALRTAHEVDDDGRKAVHGDARGPNILVHMGDTATESAGDIRVRFIDFDWCVRRLACSGVLGTEAGEELAGHGSHCSYWQRRHGGDSVADGVRLGAAGCRRALLAVTCMYACAPLYRTRHVFRAPCLQGGFRGRRSQVPAGAAVAQSEVACERGTRRTHAAGARQLSARARAGALRVAPDRAVGRQGWRLPRSSGSGGVCSGAGAFDISGRAHERWESGWALHSGGDRRSSQGRKRTSVPRQLGA